MKLNRAVPTVLLIALAAGALTGCGALGSDCGSGVPTAKAAVKGLIESSQTAKRTADVCKFASNDIKYSTKDIAKLRAAFPESELKSLIFAEGDQLGTEQPVVITSNDGTVHETMYATSADNGSWTVNFGDPNASN